MEVRYIHRVRKVQSTLLVKARKIIKLATICIAVTATNSSWMQSRARTLCPAWETSGDAHETPPNSYSSTVPVHPIAPHPQGYFSTEKLLSPWCSDCPHLQAVLTPLPRGVDVKPTPPEPRGLCSSLSPSAQNSFTGLFSWTASETALPSSPTSQPKTQVLRHLQQHSSLHAGLSCSLV